MTTIEFKKAQGDGKRKSPWSSAAGIKVEHVLAAFDFWLVGMPTDDHGNAGSSRVKVEFGQIMQNVDMEAIKFYEFSFGQLRTGSGDVDVSPDGCYGGERAERVQDFRITDIPRVQDMVDTFERGERLPAH